MSPALGAVLASWRFDAGLYAALLLSAALYLRGWIRLHHEIPARFPPARLVSFVLAELALLVAVESPLDAFGSFLLSVHMAQHLLLIAVVPPLMWMSQPFLPLLRGLPKNFAKEGLGPFLSARELQALGRAMTRPLVCWLAGSFATVFWHLPRFYELGLRSPEWHRVEHASFLFGALLFWWPVVEPWPSKAQTSRWLMIPYLLLADVVNTGLSAYLVFSSQVVYSSYTIAPRLWGISPLEDQATAGALMWVPGSIVYLLAAAAATFQAVRGPRRYRRGSPRSLHGSRTTAARERTLTTIPAHARRGVQVALFILAAFVVFDGLRGPQISPLNLAGVLPWTHWRAFAVFALIVAGNLACFSCPFTLPRDAIRRLVPPRFRWPARLRTKWIPAGLLVMFFWSYEQFRLWDSPWWTAWMILGYFAAATLIDSLFQGASFCKYVCPIGQFQFVNSLISPFEVTVRQPKVCDTCQTHDCLRGNLAHRGCELDLFQPKKQSNFDCTFCFDCVHACPHHNVGVAAFLPAHTLVRPPASRLTSRADAAALALVVVFAAFISASSMTNRAMAWTRGSSLITACIFGAGLLAAPALFLYLSARTQQRFQWAFALVPLGASMWAAHFGYHLVTAGSSIVAASARFLGIQIFRASGTMGPPGAWPSWEVLFLDAGLLLTLYLQWRNSSRSFRAFAGWALVAVALYAAGLWILAQPMQMRGMMMN